MTNAQAWDYAIGLIKVDGLEPTKEFKDYVEKEKRGEIIVVRPKEPLNISPVEKEPGELERVYQLGRKAGMEKVQAIKEFFE